MAKQPCKCGRTWYAQWHSQHGYTPICPGCQKPIKECTCDPL